MVPEGRIQKDRQRLFARACSDRTRGDDFKLKDSRSKLDVPSLEVLKIN